jgi:choline dehydrogenase-like flavoprotein
MDALRLMTTRRNVVRGIATTAASFVFPSPSFAQSVARIVVIGGGFGGAACARALRKINAKLQVTLVEPKATFTACPFSNEVVAGLRDIEAQQFNYDKIASALSRKPPPRSTRKREKLVSPTGRRFPTTVWCWRPASK